jgi:hypothetical protein
MVTKTPRQYIQPDLGIGDGTAQVHKPVDFVQEGGRKYAEARGRSYSQDGLDTVQVDPQRGHAQFLAYRQGMSQPTDPHTEASYHAMRSEVNDQYDHMTKPEHEGGMGMSVEVTQHDPYGSPQEMADDVANNRRIKVMSTATTGSHAFFTDEENDKFRAVHDVFGHAGTGRSFSRNGEEAAYLNHAQMFSPSARSAMASETRGQNSYLNYNNTGDGFPDQGNKLVGMPSWAEDSGPLPVPPKKPLKPNSQGKQLKLF